MAKSRRTATEGSSGYVFLATYIKNSKNKLPSDDTAKSKEKTDDPPPSKQPRLPQIPESVDVDDGGQPVLQFGRQTNPTPKRKRATKTPAAQTDPGSKENEQISDGDAVDVESEADKADLIEAQGLLREEKKRHDELAASLDELKDSVDRHKDYIKHFLGTDSAPVEGNIFN